MDAGIIDYVMPAVLLVGALCLLWFLHKQDKRTSAFSLSDLLVDDSTGKTSLLRVVMLGAFLYTTWLMTDIEIHRRMDIAYFGAYLGAWVGPIVTKVIAEWGKVAATGQPSPIAPPTDKVP